MITCVTAQWTVLALLWPDSYLTFTETGCGRHRRRGEPPGARLPQQMYISFLPNGEVHEPSYTQSVSSNSYIIVITSTDKCEDAGLGGFDEWKGRLEWEGVCERRAERRSTMCLCWYDKFQKNKNTLMPLKNRTVHCGHFLNYCCCCYY